MPERRLISVQPSVFRMAGAPETWHQSLMAAALAVDGDRVAPLGRRAVGPHPTSRLRRGVDPSDGQTARCARPRSSIGSRTFGPASPSSERASASPIQCGRSSTSVSSCRGGSSHRAIAQGHLDARRSRSARSGTLRDALGRPGRNGTGIVRAILDGNLLMLGKEESELEKRFTAARASGTTSRPLTLQHEVWDDGPLRRPSRRCRTRAEARDRGRRLRAPLHSGGVPARPHPTERPRRARVDGAPVHLARRRAPPGAGRAG